MAFAPDGKTLAAAGFDGEVRLYDAATGQEQARLYDGRGMDNPVPGAIEDVVISNVVARGACETSSITGLAERPVNGVTLRDVRVRSAGGQRLPGPPAVPEVEGEYPAATMFGPLPAHGLYVRHVRRLSLHDVELTTDETDARPGLAAEDVS